MLCICTLFIGLFLSPLFGVSSDYYSVLRIVDGDSLVVNCPSGKIKLPMAVRLQFINTPEMRVDNKDNPAGIEAKKFLERFIKVGDRVRLWSHHKEFQADPHGRCLAVVFPYKSTVSAQAHMISGGFTPYWRRYGEIAKPVHTDWLKREQRSQRNKQGLWSTDEARMLTLQAERQWGAAKR